MGIFQAFQNITAQVGAVFGLGSGPVVPAAPSPPLTKIRAVLTDFDEVIGDNERLMREAYERLKAESKQPLPSADVALSYAEKPKAFLDKNVSPEQEAELFQKGKAIYESMEMQLMPGAERVLQTYKETQIPLAIVSNNHFTSAHWKAMKLDEIRPNTPVFDNAKKPSEASLVKALETIGQKPGKDVIMIDDQWKGLVAAAKIGVTPVYLGNKPHIVLPIVKKECEKLGIAMPEVVVARDMDALNTILQKGVLPAQEQPISRAPVNQVATASAVR